jgi:hypothetical protein
MKTVKSLLLGSAAGLVAMAGAQAADLPVMAKPVQYVKICSLYGAGFYYIPGTDTCIKLGGFVRYEWVVNAGGSFGQYLNGANAQNTRLTTYLTERARGIISVDTRSQTQYGTLRSYIRGGFQWTTNDGLASGSGQNGGSPLTYMDRAFIQLAGFTMGRTQSFFDFFVTPAFSYQTNPIGSDSGGTGIPLLAYTASFGNGFSATLSFEDETQRNHNLINGGGGVAQLQPASATTAVGVLATTNVNGNGVWNASQSFKDVVANLRVDQAWGSAQIMGALHPVRASYYAQAATTAGAELNGHPGDQWGWAIGGGVTVNLPWAKGDQLSFQVNYAQGAPGYTHINMGSMFVYNGATLGIGWIPDGVYNSPGGAGALGAIGGTGINLTTTWSFMAGISHWWVPNVQSTLYGGYANARFNAQADAIICAMLGVAAGCGTNSSYWQIGTRTIWNPVPNMDVGVDILYNRVGSALKGFATGAAWPAFGAKPAGAGYVFADQNVWAGILRFQRNFWP